MVSGRAAVPGPPRHGPASGLGVLALGLLLAVAGASVLATAWVAPQPADAPVTSFSAARAWVQVEQVAVAPRPVGSGEHARVREYLLADLGGWGWRTEVHEAVGATNIGQPGTQPVALVRNIVATWPGTDPTGTVVLAAHYDTVAGSPGAADDGLGLGTVLEVARALTAPGAAPIRNDVVVLLTDAEEPGLLGAEAFARERAAALGHTVVLNHEARGVRGVPATFRTTSPNGGLLDALARAPRAVVESSGEVVVEALPNGTDFTHFAAAGMHAIDTAVTAGGAYYHSPVDDLGHLSPASLQQMGDTSLTVAREVAGADLSELNQREEQLVTTLPWGLLRYPAALEAPLGVVAAALAVAVVAVRRHRRSLTLPRTAASVLVAVLALAAAGLAGWAGWRAALLVDPGQASIVVGDPYRPVPYQVAILLAAGGAVLAVLAPARRRLGADTLAAGSLLLLAGMGALLTIHGAGGCPGCSCCRCSAPRSALSSPSLLPDRSEGGRAAAVLVASAGVAALLSPAAWAALDAGLGLRGPSGAVLAGAGLLLLLPMVDLAWPPPRAVPRRDTRRAAVRPAIALLVVATTVGAGLVANREGATAPRQEQLLYSVDADTGEAMWASFRPPASAWSTARLTQPPAALDDVVPAANGTLLAHGPAARVDLPASQIAVLTDIRRDEGRELVLSLSSARGAPLMGLWVNAGTGVRTRRNGGRPRSSLARGLGAVGLRVRHRGCASRRDRGAPAA